MKHRFKHHDKIDFILKFNLRSNKFAIEAPKKMLKHTGNVPCTLFSGRDETSFVHRLNILL
jgi:hypothetical protein